MVSLIFNLKITFFILTLCVIQLYAVSRHRAIISMRHPLKNIHPRISIAATNYREFIDKSDLFIDKTLLLERILNDDNNIILITSPPKFGKTIALSMIKEFLRIETDSKGKRLPSEISSNHQFFKYGIIISVDNKVQKLKDPPAISEHRFILEKYQGKHPVIYLDLSDIGGKSFDSILNIMGNRLKKAFEEHKYMVEILRELASNETLQPSQREQANKDLIIFERMIEEKITDGDFTESVLTLSRVLREHFNEKIVLLIDNYDSVLQDVMLHQSDFPVEDEQKLMKFLESFYHCSIVSNPHYFKIVITAVLPMYISQLFDKVLKDMIEYQYHQRLYPYSGFTELEISKLFVLANISRNQSHQAVDWYNGYKSQPIYNVNLYNPWSISRFVNEHQALSYWANKMNLTMYLKNVIENQRFLDLYLDLLYRKRISVDFTDVDLSERYVKKLKNIIHFPMPEVTKYSINVIMWFLLKIGYLTITGNTETASYYIEIPNKEVKEDMSFLLLNYFHHKYNVQVEYITDAVSTLVDFATKDTDESESLKRALQRVLRCLPSASSDKRNVLMLMHKVVAFITSQVPLTYEGCDIVQHELYATMVLYTQNQGIIIVVKVDPHLYYTALIDAKKYAAVFTCNKKFKDIAWIKYIGIEITAHKTVYIYAESQMN